MNPRAVDDVLYASAVLRHGGGSKQALPNMAGSERLSPSEGLNLKVIRWDA